MSIALARLQKEVSMLQADPPPGAWANPIEGKPLTELEAGLLGPVGTVYEGGVFKLEVNIPLRCVEATVAGPCCFLITLSAQLTPCTLLLGPQVPDRASEISIYHSSIPPQYRQTWPHLLGHSKPSAQGRLETQPQHQHSTREFGPSAGGTQRRRWSCDRYNRGI